MEGGGVVGIGGGPGETLGISWDRLGCHWPLRGSFEGEDWIGLLIQKFQ